MFETRQNSMFVVCITLGLALLATKYRKNVFKGVNCIYQGVTEKVTSIGRRSCPEEETKDKEEKKNEVYPDNIILVDTPESCDYAIQRIRCNLSNNVLGFDCEWVKDNPVSLLQLATGNGLCALFCLNKIGYVPRKLEELLLSPDVLKVGVEPIEDVRRLMKDYQCRVNSVADLRVLSSRFGLLTPRNLAGLCLQYLDIEIEKTTEIRCSDWNTDRLSPEQIAYAAIDAYVAVLVYHQILDAAKQKRSLWKNFISRLKKYLRVNKIEGTEELLDVSQGALIEDATRFKVQKNDATTIKNKNDDSPLISVNKISSSVNESKKYNRPTRQKPLYHNCYLEAPDGEILCTCDEKKARWYIKKELGEIVRDDPLTVRLNFEPSGRALGKVGEYYTQIKINQCVVCGVNDSFIKKNVVPKEYRKFFPVELKSHQSHDVLLLCPTCHQESNIQDLQFRRELAKRCNAPLMNTNYDNIRDNVPQNRRKLQNAVKVLRDPLRSIPQEKRRYLEKIVLQCTGYPAVMPELLDFLHKKLKKIPAHVNRVNVNTLRNPTDKQIDSKINLHGLKVVNYFMNVDGGLIELEKIWREHFLNTMKPKYLPKLWSVTHNEERLNSRCNKLELKDA